MSKIYQALERAERERGTGTPPHPDLSLLIASEAEPAKEAKPLRPGPDVRPAASGVLFSLPRDSLAAEQFRKLRAKLIRLKYPDSPRTIMITSATNGEGKTQVAASLAAGIAKDLAAQALLVDCDLRKPSLSDLFGCSNCKGMFDYLTGDGVIQEMILKTRWERLNILPAGSIKENPAELIGSKQMEFLIGQLKAQESNRYIVLDSTPILATTEPEVLGRLVDGIVLVIRAGVTPRETVRQALRSLEREKIVGIVLNDVVFKTSALHSRYFGSDGYDRYRYGYGDGQSQKKGWLNGRSDSSAGWTDRS